MLRECYSITGNDFEALRLARAFAQQTIHESFVTVGPRDRERCTGIEQCPSVTSRSLWSWFAAPGS